MKPYDKQLVLENGKQFFGYGFGADKSACLLYTSDAADEL